MEKFWLLNLAIGCSSFEDGFSWLFATIGAFIIVIGIGTIIGYLEDKKFIKHTWQAGFILLIIALGIIALSKLIK